MLNPMLAPLAPTSPMRPLAWTDEIAEAAKAHTAEAYPCEAVGIVEDGSYVRLDNISSSPDRDVALCDDDLIRVARAELFFHSHPDGIGSPSERDMIYQQQIGCPFVVIVWPLFDVFWWGDALPRAPLIGRGFRHGVHDCYALLRDWYAERGVSLLDQPRDWQWWTKEHGGDLYRQHFERAGFRQIDRAEAYRPGDGLMMSFGNPVPMHGAVVLDRDTILHHPAGLKAVDPTRLSVVAPRSRYARHVTFAVRPA